MSRPGLRRVMPVVLVWLAAGLGLLVCAPQAAFAASAGVSAVSAGGTLSCALESGRAYCWGDNNDGELGNGSTVRSSIPVPVDPGGVLAGKTLTRISAGRHVACALDSAGAAYCWGDNEFGELGAGTAAAHSSVPVAVDASGVLAGKTLTRIAVAGDDNVACAVDSAGAAFCWGSNEAGRLGDGSTVPSEVPVAVDASGVLAGKTLTQISAGGSETCVLDSAGAAFCWGINASGQLGTGTTSSYSAVPVAVDAGGALAGKTLTQVSAGDVHACVLDRAGAAYCWGEGGTLGDGSTASSAVPVAVDTSGVLAGKTLTQIASGGSQNCALDSAGALYCWGPVYLGNGSDAGSDVPVLTGPQAPAGVTAVPGHGTAAVSWTAPASLDGGTLTGYTATAAPGGAACTTTGATTCIITGLKQATYSITVAARTTAGDSGASAPATITLQRAGPIVSGYRHAKCVDDNGDSAANDTKIVIWDCDSSPQQNWTIETGGTIRIHGKCMDIYRDQKTSNAKVELWTCTGGANQQWQPRNGTLINPVSGKCLDDPRFNTTNGTQLQIHSCNRRASQQWELPRNTATGTSAPPPAVFPTDCVCDVARR